MVWGRPGKAAREPAGRPGLPVAGVRRSISGAAPLAHARTRRVTSAAILLFFAGNSSPGGEPQLKPEDILEDPRHRHRHLAVWLAGKSAEDVYPIRVVRVRPQHHFSGE